MHLSRVFTDPDSFFEDRVKYRGIGIPILLLLGLGLLRSFEWLIIYQRFFGTKAQYNYEALVIIFAVLFIFVPLFLWTVLTTSMYIIGRLLGGRMRMEVVLPVTSWGFIPYAGTALSWAAGRYFAMRGQAPCERRTIVCEGVYNGDLNDQFTEISGYITHGVGDARFIGLFVLGVLFLLWAAYLWIVALDAASTLDRRRATIAVGIPVVAYVLLQAFVTFPSI